MKKGRKCGPAQSCFPVDVCYAGILPILGNAALSPAAIFTSYNVVVTNNYTDQSHVQGTTYANNLDAINVPDFAQSSAAGTGDTLTVTGNITGSTITLERAASFATPNPPLPRQISTAAQPKSTTQPFPSPISPTS